jgi:hypothetical protein
MCKCPEPDGWRNIYTREHFRPSDKCVAEIILMCPFFRNPKLSVISGFLVSVNDLKLKCSFRSSSSKQSREGDDSC